MATIRVTKEFTFEMAHALQHYDGLCRNIHGHTYRLFVTVIGEPDTTPFASANGMVIDFTILKKIVNDNIVQHFDHALVLHESYPFDAEKTLTKLIKVNFQPTCENLLLHFVDCIKSKLPQSISLHSLRLHETITSYAEWYATDN